MGTNRRLEFRPKKSQRRRRSPPLPLLSSALVDNSGAHPRIHPRRRCPLDGCPCPSFSPSARHSAPQWMKFFVINLVQERGDRMRWRERAFDHPRSRWPWWSTRTLRLPAALIRLCCGCGGRRAATKHIVYLQQYQLVLPRPRSHCTRAPSPPSTPQPRILSLYALLDRPTGDRPTATDRTTTIDFGHAIADRNE